MTEKRLAELEVKFSFQEDAVAALNDVVYQQQTRIDTLEALLNRYRQYLDGAMVEPHEQLADNEKPPHY